MINKPTMASRFLFIRHCESTWTPEIIGFHDGDLTAEGRLRASKIRLPPPLTHIYSSDLLRTRSTANIINGSYPLTVHPELQEYRYHEKETEKEFYDRTMPFIQMLIHTNNNFVIVSHAKVFQLLTKTLCDTSLTIDYGDVYEFTFDDGWRCELNIEEIG